jgi:YqjK-like protein
MMRERLLVLAERRARLAAQANAERETIAALLVPFDAMSARAATFLGIARTVAERASRYPLFVATGVALLAVLRPGRTVRWLTRAWSLWRLYQGARGWWQRFSAGAGTPVRIPR